MMKIGLTGGIGSGKSIVSSLLEVMGIPVYDADAGSKRLTITSPLIRQGLIGLFGETIYRGDAIDRKRLAACIFSDPEMLKRVNAIIHPEVSRHFLDWADRQTSSSGICAIETAILFESGFNRLVDLSLMVTAPLERRIERVMARDGATRDEVLHRIKNQWPDEVKKTYASYIIYNEERQALIPQLTAFLAGLRR
ncbi:MAG: dephospho-CoA kinase [Tannerellaceae bacterium]|jgi:dephospho-CoA kinase|nr:dephospho-CoA kinase [Tannerellaceae bacterium]